MPHLVIYYTGQLDELSDMTALCRALARTMQAQRDEADKPVFPSGGIRVLAYPAAHWAVADGRGDYGFVYLNLRLGRGRSQAVHEAVGEALGAVAREHFEPLIASRPVGVTLQIDVGPEVFDAKHGSLHPLFQNPS